MRRKPRGLRHLFSFVGQPVGFGQPFRQINLFATLRTKRHQAGFDRPNRFAAIRTTSGRASHRTWITQDLPSLIFFLAGSRLWRGVRFHGLGTRAGGSRRFRRGRAASSTRFFRSTRIGFPRFAAVVFFRLLVALAAIVRLIEAAALENHRRASTKQAAQFLLFTGGAFREHRSCNVLELFEFMSARVAQIIVSWHRIFFPV